MLDLPNLRYLSVRDFGRCPDSKTPAKMLDSSYCNRGLREGMKEAGPLLFELRLFTSVVDLKLHGITCPMWPLPELLVPLRHLFSSLESLCLILCDTKLTHALVEVTASTPQDHMRSLSTLTITSDDYILIPQYLALRTSRGLPRLKLLTVNPRMALLRHFYADYAENMQVMDRNWRNIPQGMGW
jgi:hypothetical protein